MSQQWFIRRGNQEKGPLTPQELKQLAATGKLTATDLVRTSEKPDWREAETVKGLFAKEPLTSKSAPPLTMTSAPPPLPSTSTRKLPPLPPEASPPPLSLESGNQEWHYAKEGKQLGPVSLSELKQLGLNGNLSPADLICREDWSEWKRADSVKELFPQETDQTTASKWHNTNLKKLAKLSALTVGGFVGCLILMGLLFSAMRSESGTGSPTKIFEANKVTRENYNRIKDGMTLAEVQALIGAGQEMGSSGEHKSFKWQDNESAAFMTIMIVISFNRDRVVSKSIAP